MQLQSLTNKINFDKTYFYLTLFFAFILPLSRALISISLIVFLLFWIIEGDFKRKYNQIKSSLPLIFLCLFLIMIFISIFYASDMHNALKYLRRYGYLFVIVIIATSLKKDYFNAILWAFLLGMLTSIIIALSPFIYNYSFVFSSLQEKTLDFQYFNPFMISIQYSIYLSFCIIILLNKITNCKKIDLKFVFLAIFLILALINLFLSNGRTGQVAFIFALFAFIFTKYNLSLKTLLISLLSCITIIIIAYNFLSIQSRVLKAQQDISQIAKHNYYTSIGIRIAFWDLSFQTFKQNLAFGSGDYQDIFTKIVDQDPKYGEEVSKFLKVNDPHNQILLLLVQFGIVGFALFALMYFFLFNLAIPKEKKTIFCSFLILFLASCFSESLLNAQFTIVLFVLFTGLFLSLQVNNSKTDKAQINT